MSAEQHSEGRTPGTGLVQAAAGTAAVIIAALAIGFAATAALAIAGKLGGKGPAARQGELETTFLDGRLSQKNSWENTYILVGDRMVPGDVRTGTVTITNDGDVPANYRLAATNLSDSPGREGGRLSRHLVLRVDDVTEPALVRNAYLGAIGAMRPLSLGRFEEGEARTYRFTATFPRSGTGAGANATDSSYIRASMNVDYEWTATPAPEAARAIGPMLTVNTPAIQRPMRTRALLTYVRCARACTVTAGARLAGTGAARPISLRPVKRRLGAQRRVRIAIKLSRRAQAVLAATFARRLNGRAIVTIRAKGRDGKVQVSKRKLTLRP